MKKATKIAALAVALAVVMTAFVVTMDQGPLSTGSADTGDDDNNNPPGDDNNNGNDPNDDVPPGDEPSVTTITATKTAVGFYEKRIVYSWDVEKYLVDEVCEMQIEPGESALISYVIDAERSVTVTEVFGVRGFITVTNTGDCPTEGLAICDTVQIMDECGFVDHATVEVDVSAMPVLQPGECYAYPYEIVADHGLFDVCYNNVATVLITNFEGCDGAFGVDACAEFTIPCECECIVIDETAVLTDYFSIPCGFAAVPMTEVGPWVLGGDDRCEWEFCIEFLLENREAPRYNTYCIANLATLVPCDTQCPIEAGAQLTVATGEDETTLCVEKTAAVTCWTEYIAYELDAESALLLGSVEFVPEESELEPVIVEQECVANIHTLTVAGAVKVVNTGCYPTEGLTIVDTIYMLAPEAELSAFCADWVEIANVTVDTTCKPMLLPGEWFYYPYEITFTVDDLEFVGLASGMFMNEAYVEICNYDDDVEYDGVYAYAPIMLPLCPNQITVETCAAMECCDEIPLGECASLNVQTAFSYRQLIVVNNYDDRSTMDVCTEITLNGRVWANDCICGASTFSVAISNSQSKVVCGDVRSIELSLDAFGDDCETYTFCFNGEEVVVDIYAFLCYAEGQMLYLDPYSFEFGEQKLLIGGVLVDFELNGEQDEL